jgi:hypothetical protein
LEAVFRGGSYDGGFVDACELLASTDESWVFRVPTALIDRLEGVEDGAIASLADRWSASEEFALDRWSRDDVQRTLVEMVRLVKLSRATGRDLLLWMSL